MSSRRGRNQPEEKIDPTLKYYKTIDGIKFEDGCPFQYAREKACKDSSISSMAALDEVKKALKFPKTVDYVPKMGTKPPYLIVGAHSPEEAKQIILGNKDIIEKSCNSIISKDLKLEEGS